MKKFAVFVIALNMNILLLFGGISLADLNDGLVAYYPFNANANDETGYGRDGMVYGATWIGRDVFKKLINLTYKE